jgi:hypothetical protein
MVVEGSSGVEEPREQAVWEHELLARHSWGQILGMDLAPAALPR